MIVTAKVNNIELNIDCLLTDIATFIDSDAVFEFDWTLGCPNVPVEFLLIYSGWRVLIDPFFGGWGEPNACTKFVSPIWVDGYDIGIVVSDSDTAVTSGLKVGFVP